MSAHGSDSNDAIAGALSRARRGLAPTTSERAATLGRLSAELLGASPLSGSSGALDCASTSGGALGGAGLGGATLGKTLATVLVVGLAVGGSIGFGGGYWARSQPGATQLESVAEAAIATASALEAEPEKAPLGVVEVLGRDDWAGGIADRVNSAAPEQGQRTARSSSPPTIDHSRSHSALRREHPALTQTNRSKPAVHASDDEVAFVRRAQKALRNGDAAWALALMRTLDEQLPQGALLTERNVTRVLALCQMGRKDEARAVAERTLRSDRGSAVYATRLAASCAYEKDSTSD